MFQHLTTELKELSAEDPELKIPVYLYLGLSKLNSIHDDHYFISHGTYYNKDYSRYLQLKILFLQNKHNKQTTPENPL